MQAIAPSNTYSRVLELSNGAGHSCHKAWVEIGVSATSAFGKFCKEILNRRYKDVSRIPLRLIGPSCPSDRAATEGRGGLENLVHRGRAWSSGARVDDELFFLKRSKNRVKRAERYVCGLSKDGSFRLHLLILIHF